MTVLVRYFLYFAAILVIPLTVAICYEFFIDNTIYHSTSASLAFLATLGICLIAAGLLHLISRRSKRTLYRKDCILLVVLIWLFSAGIGSCPFLFTKTIRNPVDAYFEAMSGLTTTGATILYPKMYEDGQEIAVTEGTHTFYGTVEPLKDPATNSIVAEGIEALGKPLLFWRSFMQWLGGMGIVVLFIAVFPALSMGGKFLFESETSSTSNQGLLPRIKETASILWKIYLGLTLAQVVLLKVTNTAMPLFDAITLSFSTISTGGFTVTNQGLLSYASTTTPWIIVLFMIAGSINFTLYFHTLRGKLYRLYEPEFLLYLVILGIGCLLMVLPSRNLFQGIFMAISAQTSTGFSLISYELWPWTCQLLMVILMFIGGMSGSTTGGIKVYRCFIILRQIKNRIESLFRPETVRVLKVGDREISPQVSQTVFIFFALVVIFTLLGTYLLVYDHQDPFAAFGIISSMINNTGLSIGGVGPMGSFAFLPSFSKIVCIVWMILGRLEYLSILVLFAPSFWKK